MQTKRDAEANYLRETDEKTQEKDAGGKIKRVISL